MFKISPAKGFLLGLLVSMAVYFLYVHLLFIAPTGTSWTRFHIYPISLLVIAIAIKLVFGRRG